MRKLRSNKGDTANAKLIVHFLKSENLELLSWTPQQYETGTSGRTRTPI